jgi:hypothetical protein
MACGCVKINRDKVSAGIAIIVIMFILSLTCPNTQAQTNITFNPADKFLVPTYNGSISFAVNGTYSNAAFENNTWIFTNLQLNGSQLLENFQISAQNSNVTIFSCLAVNVGFPILFFSYAIEGKGEQILNLGLGPSALLDSGAEWSVSVSNVSLVNTSSLSTHFTILAEGDDWSISHDGTITVNGLSGDVNIIYTNYLGNVTSSSKLPFYQQYSVAIATATALVIVVVIAVVIKVKNRGKWSENELV